MLKKIFLKFILLSLKWETIFSIDIKLYLYCQKGNILNMEHLFKSSFFFFYFIQQNPLNNVQSVLIFQFSFQ